MENPSPGIHQVVFVDDDPLVLDGLRRALYSQRKEWEIHLTCDPTEALSILAKGPSCVMISDWMMPQMDGLKLCEKAREQVQEEASKSLYFILMTGKHDSDDVVRALESGVDDYIKKPFDRRELIARIGIGQRLLKSEQALLAANARLTILATTDPLTELLNRRRGLEVLDGEVARVKRGKQTLAVMMFDLDHFKRINDTYGHDAGDAVLKQVARCMTHTFREYDAKVRWGGDEFLVILPHTDAIQASAAAERFRKSISQKPVDVGPSHQPASITVSIGTAILETASMIQASELVSRADRAMYTAKNAGRNRVEPWTEP